MKNIILKKRLIRLFSFFVENIILPLGIVLISVLYWGAYYTSNNLSISHEIYNFLSNDLGRYLMKDDGAIVTVATVFIGIYFSIYTMFTSIQTDSVMYNLGKSNFKKLLNILGIGFLSSFFYTLYSIFFEYAYSNYRLQAVFLVLLLLITFMISAFQFGVIIYIILQKDIATTIEELDERKEKELRTLNVQQKLENFLNSELDKEAADQAERMSEKLKSSDK